MNVDTHGNLSNKESTSEGGWHANHSQSDEISMLYSRIAILQNG